MVNSSKCRSLLPNYMNLIIFCPPKIIFQHRPEDWAKIIERDGVILTCASQRSAVSAHLGPDTNCHFFDDFANNATVEIEACEIAKSFAMPFCVAMAEIDLLRAARVNDHLGVSEGSEERLHFYRDKFDMKSLAREKGLRVANMEVVTSAMDIRKFLDMYGFPVVLKPRDGRGSNGVRIVRNTTDLAIWLREQPTSTFYNTMIETFVEGDHYIVNGLYIDGRAIIVSPVRVMTSALDFLGGKSHNLHMLDATNGMRQRLIAYARNLVENVMPSQPTMLFHLEVFIAPSGDIVLGEIASRLGGCFFNQEMTHAWGLDPRLTFLRALKNSEYRPAAMTEPVQMVGHINIPPRDAFLRSGPSECPFKYVLEYKISAKPMTRYSGMQFTNAEILNAIVAGHDEQELQDRLHKLENWFHSQCDWQEVTAA